MSTEAELKVRRLREYRKEYFAFLDRRIPELHASGFPGRTARRQADADWADHLRGQA